MLEKKREYNEAVHQFFIDFKTGGIILIRIFKKLDGGVDWFDLGQHRGGWRALLVR